MTTLLVDLILHTRIHEHAIKLIRNLKKYIKKSTSVCTTCTKIQLDNFLRKKIKK